MKIPFLSFEATLDQTRTSMQEAFSSVLESKWYVLGNQVKQFEAAYADFNDVQHCVGVSNGLDALFLSLKALGIQEGDEVILPSNTYIASALAVSYTGAKPVFVEPDIRTYNINPALIEAAITEKTKVIMPVHLYGQCCEMGAVMDVAKRHGLFVVEDNAQSQGSAYRGRIAGSFGDINGTSFYPGKNLGALGDAGGVTTDNKDLADRVTTLRNYGSQRKYYNEVIGYNMRLDELQAALLQVKLAFLPAWTKERQQIADWYNAVLAGSGDLVLPAVATDCTHVYHLYVIRTAHRERLQNWLQEKGTGTLIHYPVPIHLQQAYAHLGHKPGDFPLAEQLSDTVLSLPMWPGLQHEQVEEVASQIKSFFETL